MYFLAHAGAGSQSALEIIDPIFTPNMARVSRLPEYIPFLCEPVSLGGEIIGGASWEVGTSE